MPNHGAMMLPHACGEDRFHFFLRRAEDRETGIPAKLVQSAVLADTESNATSPGRSRIHPIETSAMNTSPRAIRPGIAGMLEGRLRTTREPLSLKVDEEIMVVGRVMPGERPLLVTSVVVVDGRRVDIRDAAGGWAKPPEAEPREAEPVAPAELGEPANSP